MDQIERRRYARVFGLPVEQIRLFGELSEQQDEGVAKMWGRYKADQYVYAARRDGGLVPRRYQIDGREVRGY